MDEILIADSSGVFAMELKAELASHETVHSCDNAQVLLKMLQREIPRILVLDLSLPGCDGIELLRRITAMPVRPAVLVTVDYISDFLRASLAGMGIGYLVIKPCSVDIVAKRVREMFQFYADNPVSEDLLYALKISEKLTGATYIRYALPMLMANPNLQLTKELYPMIGAKFGKTPQSVERSIRNAIHTTWEKYDGFIWQDYLTNDPDGRCNRPSNSEFFHMLLHMIHRAS